MKKFIALALALAMMVSCLVFNASAEDSVAVILQGPTTVAKDGTFQVKVRVTDTQNIVGGVQGMVDVTGATVTKVQVNPDLLTWNKTSDANTIYKLDENNDVTFASLNKLTSDSYTTRVWFTIDYQVTDAEAVSVALANVKVSNKEAKAITPAATSGLKIDVVDTATEPNVTLMGAGIYGYEENKDGTKDCVTLVDNQGMLVYAGAKNIEGSDVTGIGVVFYPTALLGGDELTVETQGAVVAEVNKADDATRFNKIATKGYFFGELDYNFTETVKALAFLGTKVTARVYYKTANGIVYASNTVDKYIKNGVASKAALSTITDEAGAVTNPTWLGDGDYATARAGLNSSDEKWQENRAYVLEYCVRNVPAK